MFSFKDLPLCSFGVEDDIKNSDVTLVPVAMFRDPFLRGHHKLVVCEAQRDGKPSGFNKRTACSKIMDLCAEYEIQVGMEQEYTMLALDDSPFGWPKNGCPKYPIGWYNKLSGTVTMTFLMVIIVICMIEIMQF